VSRAPALQSETIADLFRSKDWNQGGTVSNVASRLCDEAKPGQILISPLASET
jgi:class 3 adenylate cyclase